MRAAAFGLGLMAVLSAVACTTTEVRPGFGSETNPTEPVLDPTDPENPPKPIVPGIAVSDVAVFQAVKVPVVTGAKLTSAAKRTAPVVAGRPGMIRVYVKTGSDWSPQPVTAEIRLVTEDKKFPILRQTKRISESSNTDEDGETTFDLEVPGESLPPGVTFQVALTGTAAEGAEKIEDGVESDGRWPANGAFADLGAQASDKVRVVIVPVKYEADDSGRLPPLDEEQLALFKKTMMSKYPATDVEITQHAPYPWTTKIGADGQGFSQILSAMHQLRKKDKVDKNVYYYGLFSPNTSLRSYCSRGCVMGLSALVDEDAAVLRASVGVGFEGQESANTMAHEVGHAHGREHAPCGNPDGPDADYPHDKGIIGVWGYDIFEKTMISPSKGKDMMGYCPNEWVSDYTYNALFERINAVKIPVAEPEETTGGETEEGAKGAEQQAYRIALVDGAGAMTWDGEMDVQGGMKGGEARTVRFVNDHGVEMKVRTARFYKFDHLPGGILYMPAEKLTAWKSVKVQGFTQKLAR